MKRVCMLCFTKHYKDTIQQRLIMFISFCSKFTGVQVCQNYQNEAQFDEVIAAFFNHGVFCITFSQ